MKEMNLDMLLKMSESGVPSMDIERKTVSVTYEWKDGEAVAVNKREETKNILSGKGEATEKDGENRDLRKEVTDFKIINRQTVLIKTVTEYYPQPSGHPLRIRKEETYRDGAISSRTEYDKPDSSGEQGKMLKRESYVKDCEGIVAVDTPTGKMVPELDEKGEPVKDPFTKGGLKLIPEVKRVMKFKDAIGNDIEILTLSETNAERAKKNLPSMNPDEYMSFLAGSLQTDKQKAAFPGMMLHYRADTKDTDHWQTGEQTSTREYNGEMVGDCEDNAIFWRRINELQGRKSYVLGLPEHAECITFVRRPNGKIGVIRSGTFGYKEEKPDFENQQQALEYLTDNVYRAEVSHVEELEDGRFFPKSKPGSKESPKVTVLELDTSKTDEKERQRTPSVDVNELHVNSA